MKQSMENAFTRNVNLEDVMSRLGHAKCVTTIKYAPEPPEASAASPAMENRQLFEGYEDLLSIQDLRKLTGLSEQTLRAEVIGGHLPGCRIGRRLYVPKTKLLDYVENGGGIHA